MHLYDFFKFFAVELNTSKIGISIRGGGFTFLKDDPNLGKDARYDGKLCVESPLFVTDDVASGAYNYGAAKKHFKIAVYLFEQRGFLGPSLLRLVIDPRLFTNFSED